MARLSYAALLCLGCVKCLAEEAAIFPPDAAPRREESSSGSERFNWSGAVGQSMLFLTIQHGARLRETKTQVELDGPFAADYWRSVKGLEGWRDQDPWPVNYVAHPLQGAVSGYIQVQNDPKGRTLNITDGAPYWRSRLKAMVWSTAYSLQFELGPFSEAAIGNVGSTPGKMGFVDLVVTPTGGIGLVVAEDLLDHYVVRPLEPRSSPVVRATLRMALSPTRSFANLLRLRPPWRRDNRARLPRVAHNLPEQLSSEAE